MALPTSYHGAAYRTRLKNDLSAVIESEELGLSNLHRQYLRSRWMEQVLTLEHETSRAARRHHAVRLTTVIGSLIVLVLVSMRFDDPNWISASRYLSIAFSLLVTLSVALEQVYQYGERWRKNESMVERLKAEGWRFLQLSGHYRRYRTHAEAFPIFANQIEELNQHEVEVYVTEVARPRERESDRREEVNAVPSADAIPKQPAAPKPELPPLMTNRAALRDVVANRATQQQQQQLKR
jgi:hypothetical protein